MIIREMESLLATNRQLSLKLEGQQVIDQDTLDRAEKYSAMAAETERLREEVGGDPLCPRTGYALFSALADARLRDSGVWVELPIELQLRRVEIGRRRRLPLPTLIMIWCCCSVRVCGRLSRRKAVR